MRAFICNEPNAELQEKDIPNPEPAAGQVCLRIAACGLNFADLLMMKGTYQDTPEFPLTPGLEVAGRVDSVGEGVDQALIGTRMAGFSGAGGLAEFVCLPADRCAAIPDALTDAQAAGFQIAYGTSHIALDHLAKLRAGETLLVTGAAGGVGLTAVEIGKKMGAKVIAVARGSEKLDVAKNAGADILLDSETADVRADVKAVGGADVLYDSVGGDVFTQAYRACRPGARILPIGFASGDVPQIPANHLLVKNQTVFGFYWGGYMKLRPEVVADSLATLFKWADKGLLTPPIGHEFGFEDAPKALELLRARKSTGKVVVLADQSRLTA